MRAVATVFLLCFMFTRVLAGSTGPLPDPNWGSNGNSVASVAFDIGGSLNDYATAAAVDSGGGQSKKGDGD